MGDYDYPALDPMEMLALSGGLREEPQPPARGTYRMRVYGRADALLYEAYYPSLSSFRYERQGDGLVGVVAIQIDWLEM